MAVIGRASEVLVGSGAPGAVALVEGGRVLTHGDLVDEVAKRAAELDLPPRSLVVLGITNTLDAVVTYLALLHGGHVPLLAGAHHEALADAWHPDAVIRTAADGWTLERRPRAAGLELHPELALLLSTSGSTGAPKLVRLSHANLASNATAIASYLALTPDDRGITSLPLHYCYGLSVLHSHLAAGAGVVMTSASVVDPCFAAALRLGEVTNVAGVPHTFDLLEQAGPDRVHVPSLRFLTQAGGRMEPSRVRTWLDRTAGWGVDLFVMYGQTEATARMAYLPPALAHRHPGAIGRPIPGGHLELRPVDDAPDGVGEIVYRGPNVMLGYATEPADLAAGATVAQLATGDLGRFDAVDGVFEVVGRRSRFVKPFGLRVDLDAVELALVESGIDAVVTGDDERLVVAAPGGPSEDIRRRVADLTGLPITAVVVDVATVPRTASGKVDHAAVLRRAGANVPTVAPAESAAAVFASVLGRPDIGPSSSFVDLGGDSLSYVECSVLLEERLGRLPHDWHLRRVDELDALGRRVGLPRLDTTALLRAVGILLVVSTHLHLWYFPGGSHLMLAIVGFNACRFLFSIDGTKERATAAGRSIARLAVPTVAFVAVCMALVGGYGIPTLTLTNGYLGPTVHTDGRWHYWFIEVAVQLLLVAIALLSIGPVRRAERRFTYAFPLLLLAVTVVMREVWVVDNLRFQAHGVAWFFVLGWLVHRSDTVRTKLLTTVLCVVTPLGFFGMPHREGLIAGGLVLLTWCREIPMPRVAIRPIAVVAAASLAIYVSHFRLWRVFDRSFGRGWAYVLTVLAGIAIWFVGERLVRAVRGRAAAARYPSEPRRAPTSSATASTTRTVPITVHSMWPLMP